MGINDLLTAINGAQITAEFAKNSAVRSAS